ncbi:MAG: exodeoxyribonuclease VII small subunit [Pelagibacteraceae bacterium]|jgi:exodeoxyribonuclease VII small subunit|uniref:exodeoxyribonuclease VII small subunit n=1 Tax=unclassified Candidatus Pelagibacter TaxID=2647897 RepID=UPI0001BB47DF|nr:exodeoxyribonuclease VII, small subunit [alpha proteobacterium HIMB114]RZO90296.1 MAG: exodeoxyribonuclease VII small subunit [alpha proteobacterium HIMB114]
MNKANKYADIEKMSFEKAMAELETIVSDLENGSIELEESIEKYQRGIQLKKHCDQKLKEANMKIDQIEIDKNGNVTEKPFVRKKK